MRMQCLGGVPLVFGVSDLNGVGSVGVVIDK